MTPSGVILAPVARARQWVRVRLDRPPPNVRLYPFEDAERGCACLEAVRDLVLQGDRGRASEYLATGIRSTSAAILGSGFITAVGGGEAAEIAGSNLTSESDIEQLALTVCIEAVNDMVGQPLSGLNLSRLAGEVVNILERESPGGAWT